MRCTSLTSFNNCCGQVVGRPLYIDLLVSANGCSKKPAGVLGGSFLFMGPSGCQWLQRVSHSPVQVLLLGCWMLQDNASGFTSWMIVRVCSYILKRTALYFHRLGCKKMFWLDAIFFVSLNFIGRSSSKAFDCTCSLHFFFSFFFLPIVYSDFFTANSQTMFVKYLYQISVYRVISCYILASC